MDKKKKMIPAVILTCAVVLLPLIVGLPLFFVTGELIYLEVMYVVLGLLLWMAITVRMRMRDSANYKANKTIFEDKTTKEYKAFRNSQFFLFGLGTLELLLSLVVFLFEII